MSTRTQARATVLALLIVFLLGRLVVLRAERQRTAPGLLPQQLVSLPGAVVSTCLEAPLAIYNADISLSEGAPSVSAAEATRIADRTLADVFGNQVALLSGPQLVSLELPNRTRRTAWARLWVMPAFDGTYTNGAVVYVDAVAALPLYLYHDFTVANPLDCTAPRLTARTRLAAATPLLLGCAMMLIAFGLVWELIAQTRRNLYTG